MRLSEAWLREWVNPDLKTQGVADCLTMAGLEVDSIEPVSPDLVNIVVGEIVEAAPHPDADRLQVCQVAVSAKKRLQIVCGASNARVGLKAPVALVGATLPGGMEIKKAKLRGVESFGMLCSVAELGLAEQADGLLELGDELKPGQSITKALELKDMAIDIDLTPNRGDCLSVAGIARELSALSATRLTPLKIKPVKPTIKTRLNVQLQADADCPHYVGRIIEGVDAAAVTPMWMQERLRRSGLRSLGPVVDVTNYILLELGQPMHAFDVAKLQGDIRVARSKGKTKLELLDGSKPTIESGTLLISDDKQALALAGIMGGQKSAVSDTTTDIFLESAYFAPSAIAGRARSLGLHTDSSHRFERGVDPQLQKDAIERATALLLDIVGGEPGPVIEKKLAPHMPKRKPVKLRHARVEKLLGIKLSATKVQRYIKGLGMETRVVTGGWRVTPPSYRFDIEREEDLIEEVARLYGYHNIPENTPHGVLEMRPAPEGLVSSHDIAAVLAARDYQEVITYSFTDQELQSKLDPDTHSVALANPIASDLAVMRTSLWPGLIKVIQHNLNRQQSRVRIFESGHRFVKKGKAAEEQQMLAGAVTGPVLAPSWDTKAREHDFFDLKGDLEALLGSTDSENSEFKFRAATHPALHPGQSAEILKQGEPIGWIGALHPKHQKELGLEQSIFLFEITMLSIQDTKIAQFREISRFPAIERDLAVVVDADVPASHVLTVVRQAAGSWLSDLQLFDDYRGEGIDSGRKSLGLGLILQDSSRTLKEVEVEGVLENVLQALQKQLGAELRQ
ncbi:MAG: phenylalanine--tRNA ligase subunit beta [Proteobacteria bacterium]|nr:phenylalanine--tRNA ligase subunit beta [Pseudomonadota bacterium]